ncbi:NAD-dependent epimerase/dehydratase family protein [Pontibacter actiniarum]|uniref:NAD-dependent epimerase/dehydratase domain-containing protein n=1 Tax=Pontibacter actiniarum TaxID=323450 RepID=A0A1X9YXG4_9BACT|nr:NAD-dependent epimerase/dehydratase family protein [Pontibacter actiniarum]ARS37559.1 hypothetical protein CA264_20195 [Pontibacter actiniarum]
MWHKHKVLVTGSAGFIGHHLMLALRGPGGSIVGLDLLNEYYDPALKYGRLALQGFSKTHIKYNTLVHSDEDEAMSFIQLDLVDEKALDDLFREQQFDIVVNLAAQAGVRYSLEHPQSYVASNLVGFANLLEACRKYPIKHFLFASSSSVYGLNHEVPFATKHNTNLPVSFYAATKKANEVMAHSYSHLYNLPVSGLRFFTVYGPWGRPDMAYFSFARAIMEGTPIRIFNNGEMYRDFTFISDVVEGIVRLLFVAPKAGTTVGSTAPYTIYNIGNSSPEHLLEMVAILERLLHKKGTLDLQPMQPGDVPITFADTQELTATTGFKPSIALEDGLSHFVDWFKTYYREQYQYAKT